MYTSLLAKVRWNLFLFLIRLDKVYWFIVEQQKTYGYEDKRSLSKCSKI